MTQGHLIMESHTQIETHTQLIQKMLGPVDIPLLGHLKCQAINSTLQSRYSQGETPLLLRPSLT